MKHNISSIALVLKVLSFIGYFCFVSTGILRGADPVIRTGPEIGSTEVEGIPINFNSQVPIAEDVLGTEIAKLKYHLSALLKKERLADELEDRDKLAQVHSIVKALSYGRETPRPNLQVYRKKRNRIDPSVLHSEVEYKGISFWSYEDALAALNSGKGISGFQLNSKTGRIERMGKRVASTPKNILVRDWVVLMEESDFNRSQLQDSFNELSNLFDAKLDLSSKQVVFNYIASTGSAVSKRNFSYIDEDQRWFHEGFARYASFGVLKELLGPENIEELWNQLYPVQAHSSISPSDLLSWDDEKVDGTSLRVISFQLFRNVQKNYGSEMLGHWFDELDDSFVDIKVGKKTVHSILEELTGDSLNDLLVYNK